MYEVLMWKYDKVRDELPIVLPRYNYTFTFNIKQSLQRRVHNPIILLP